MPTEFYLVQSNETLTPRNYVLLQYFTFHGQLGCLEKHLRQERSESELKSCAQ